MTKNYFNYVTTLDGKSLLDGKAPKALKKVADVNGVYEIRLHTDDTTKAGKAKAVIKTGATTRNVKLRISEQFRPSNHSQEAVDLKAYVKTHGKTTLYDILVKPTDADVFDAEASRIEQVKDIRGDFAPCNKII